MKLFLVRQGSRLAPATADDEKKIETLRGENWYKADIRKARNPGYHRRAFALIKLIFESQERYTSIEDLLVELKLQCGWYVEHVRHSGELIYVAKSIAFESMDQLQFERFYDRLVDVAINFYRLEDAIEFADDTVPY